MGAYDLPAMINKVIETTGQEKVMDSLFVVKDIFEKILFLPHCAISLPNVSIIAPTSKTRK